MKELLDIVKAYCQAQQPMALATVVETAGSSYRRPGARMLILADGQTIGCISGGCLDRDVVLHGLETIKNQKAVLLDYNTTADEDIIFGVGTGCKGVIHILLEVVPPKHAGEANGSSLLHFLENLFQSRSPGAVATVIRAHNKTGLQVGDRVMINNEAKLFAMAGPMNAGNKSLLDDAALALASGNSKLTGHESTSGSVEIFSEIIRPPATLVIFGAGQDAIPMMRLAKEVGLRVEIVDWRPGYLSNNRFGEADAAITAHPEDLAKHLTLDGQTAAVIMSHNFLADQACLKQLLPLNLRYLGLMGPRKRADKMLQELRAQGLEVAPEQLSKLHNPVGLDIGAEYPEQIALSVVAEIQAVLSDHAGGQLRDKKSSIHLPRQTQAVGVDNLGAHPTETLCEISA